MKKYLKPKAEVVEFDCAEILTPSVHDGCCEVAPMPELTVEERQLYEAYRAAGGTEANVVFFSW